MQVSNGHGWHGARKIARAKEQQKQQEKQQQQQKLKHKQQQQQQKQQKQKRKQEQEQQQKQKRKQEQQQNGGGGTGALSADGVKARTHTTFAHKISSDITVCWLSLLLTSAPLCVGRTVDRVREGQGRYESA